MAHTESNSVLPEISLIIPVNNEAANIFPLYEGIKKAMVRKFPEYEIVFIDDGSTDLTPREVSAICMKDEKVRLIRLSRRFGQSVALSAGFDNSRGHIIVSLDGDLQHDPEDIPRLVEKIKEGYDIVSGWRTHRVDNFLTRRLPSLVANKLMCFVFGIKLRDFGTTLKAYRREVLEDVELFGELHRFIPVLAGWRGADIAEIPISNTMRKSGKSHYGITRTWRVILDFFTVKFLTSFINRPFHLFGAIGVVCFSVGFFVASALAYRYYFLNLQIRDNIGNLIFSMLMIIFGVQLIAIGISLEISTRIYYSANRKKAYRIKEMIPRGSWDAGVK